MWFLMRGKCRRCPRWTIGGGGWKRATKTHRFAGGAVGRSGTAVSATVNSNPFPQLFHIADSTEHNSRSWEGAVLWAHATTGWSLAAALNKGRSEPPPREDVEALLWWVGPEDARTRFVDLCCELLERMFSAPRVGQGMLL